MAKKFDDTVTFKDVTKEIIDNYGMSTAFAQNMQVLFERCFENEVKARGFRPKAKKTNVRTVKAPRHIISNKEYCPIPINVITEHMGVDVDKIDTVEWERQIDGKLVNFTVNLRPQ